MKRKEIRAKILDQAEQIAAQAVAFTMGSNDRLIAEGDSLLARLKEVRKLTTEYIANRSLGAANKEAAKGLYNAVANAINDARQGRVDEQSGPAHADTIRRMRDELFDLIEAANNAPRTDGQTGSQFRHNMQDHILRDALAACHDTLLLDAAEIDRSGSHRFEAVAQEPYLLRERHVMASWPDSIPPLPAHWQTRQVGNRYAKSTSIRTGSVMESDISALIIANQNILVLDAARLDLAELVKDIGEANDMPGLTVLHRRLTGGKGEEVKYEPHAMRPIEHDIKVQGWQRPEYHWLIDMSARNSGLDTNAPLSWTPFSMEILRKKADYYADLL